MHPDTNRYELDPVFLHARREAWIIVVVFVVVMTFVLGVSFALGQDADSTYSAGEGQVALVLGMPSWVFWGVLLPWFACNVITYCFCFRIFRRDALQDAEVNSVSVTPENTSTSERVLLAEGDEDA